MSEIEKDRVLLVVERGGARAAGCDRWGGVARCYEGAGRVDGSGADAVLSRH